MTEPKSSCVLQPRASTRVRHVQLSRAPATAKLPLKAPTSFAPPSPPPPPRARLQLAPHAWLLLAASVLFCVARAAGATASAPAHAATDTGASASDWYIVLVSIPVLDKVLPLKHLAEELLHRGYRVGFALPENCRQWVSDIERLEFISLGNIVGKGRGNYLELDELPAVGVYESYAATLRYYASFQRPMFGPLMENLEDDRPNLVVVDRYTFAGLDACHAMQLPYVVNDPHLLLDMDSPPAYIPAPFSNFSMHTTSVLERCLNSYYRLRFRLVMVQVYKEINQIRREHGLPDISSKKHAYGQQLVLVNSVFGLDAARPITPQFQMVGALRSRRLLETDAHLPLEYISWLALDVAARPTVFISFQSDIPLSPQFVATLMDGLEAVDARLVWKISLQEQAAFDLRSRSRASLFFVSDDVDEATLMARSPISVLITAGDFQSIQAALVSGVPILGIPFSAEQLEGVNTVVRVGAGLLLDSHSFSEQNVQLTVERLLGGSDGDRDFRSCAAHAGELVAAGGGAERAADLVAAVVEFGASFVLPARNSQPLYKTYLVDVYLVYGAILCGAAVILRTFAAVVYSLFQVPEFEVPIPAVSGAPGGLTAPLTASNGSGTVGVKEKSA